MDRQSEAYRKMTEEDIDEEVPVRSVAYPPIQSLDQIKLPRDYPEEEGWGRPKHLAQAEGRLFERIMDPTAPDDNSVQGVYTRMMHGDAE